MIIDIKFSLIVLPSSLGSNVNFIELSEFGQSKIIELREVGISFSEIDNWRLVEMNGTLFRMIRLDLV